MSAVSDENGSDDNGLLNRNRRLQLDTGPKVRRYLSKLIRDWDDRKLASEDVSRIAHSLKILVNMIEAPEFERRLQAVEQQLTELRSP